MGKILVLALLGLLSGLGVVACSRDATKPPQTALSAHERMVLEMERAGGGAAGGGM